MRKNLTLTIDADVLKAARKVALDRDTSVNQIVRDCLAELASGAGGRKQARDDLREFFRKSRYRIGKRNWTRDELHER